MDQSTPASSSEQSATLPQSNATTLTSSVESLPATPVNSSSKKRRGKLPLVLAGCLVFVCVIFLAFGAGVFAASQSNNYIPVFSEIVEAGEKLLVSDKELAKKLTAQAATDLEKLLSGELDIYANFPKKYEYAFQLNGNVSGQNASERGKIEVTGQGSSYQNNDEIQMGLKIDSDIDLMGTKLAPYTEVRVIGKADAPFVYFNIGGIEKDLIGGLDIVNKWVEIDIPFLLQGAGVDSLSDLTSSQAPYASMLDEEAKQQLRDIIQSDEVINNFKRLPDRTYNGVRTNCFEFNFDTQDIVALSKKIAETSNIEYTQSDPTATGEISFISCVGRKDMLPYEILLSIKSEEKTQRLDLAFAMQFKNFNKDVTVEKPEVDMDFESLINEYINFVYQGNVIPFAPITPILPDSGLEDEADDYFDDLSGSTLDLQGRDNERLAVLYELQYALESYYTTTGSYPQSLDFIVNSEAIIIGDEMVDLVGTNIPKLGVSSEEGTAYCYQRVSADDYRLGVYLEDGEWGDSYLDYQQFGSNPVVCSVNTVIR